MSYWQSANHSWSKDSIRYINTPTQKTKELFYYVQEIGHFKAHKPYFTERENLASYLVKYTRHGEGSLFYNDVEYTLKRGDIFFIDCNHYQFYETISDEPWEMDWIHFYGDNANLLYKEFMRIGNNVFATDSEKVEQNKIHLILEQLLHLQKNQTAKTDFQVSVLLHELLNELIMQKYQLDFNEEEIPDYILHLKEYIDKNFSREITLDNLEQNYHLNKYQINKDFSKYMGKPPIEYQINQRITHAKDALRFSNKTLQEISMEVGIDNYAYFSRLFKKRTGITPKEYRFSTKESI